MERGPAPLRVAVVGLGFGSVHVAAFRQDPRCEVVALCSRQLERAESAARVLGISRALTDWRALIASHDIDVVSLAVPARAQPEIGSAALQAGKHVLFEKPLADTLAGAEQLAAAARGQANVVTAIDFEFPEIPAFRDAKQSLTAGAIGTLRHVAVTWRIETYNNRMKLEPSDTWKSETAAGGGALNLFGSHVLYYLEWLFGPVKSVSAALERPAADTRALDTLVTLSLVTRAGLPIVVSIATDAYQGSGHRVDIYGEGGTLVIENRSADYISGFELQTFLRANDRASVGSRVEPSSAESDGRVLATAAVVRRFVDGIQKGRASAPDVMDGLRVQRLMDAVQRSSEQRRVIDLDPE
ncbi:MAG TPA: Gfo/Idh/MocA family oxidoreductase [Polyangiales bacterium]|nr:Gfo/Idh/MocA family oxidoreductase [Polyangiales bacterium]